MLAEQLVSPAPMSTSPYQWRFQIRDLEEFSGVKAHTIRIWEKRYGLLSPDRTDTNIRTYGLEELKALL
ncbi:MAG TPA: MerR family DNA-binding transcriptional regulator, partial [Flavobacteriales bacterium]|nr:MerR family DNA-binding transcriptional regulator [Flavobacteriales bacterium]